MSRLSDAHLAVFNARMARLNASEALITAQMELLLSRLEKRYGFTSGEVPNGPNTKTLHTSTLRTVVRR